MQAALVIGMVLHDSPGTSAETPCCTASRLFSSSSVL